MPPHLLPLALSVAVAIVLLVSAIDPHDRLTWFMEVLPVLIAAPILVATFRRFPLTPMLYVLIALHAIVLIVGAEYTYARVPLGYWIQDVLDLARNPYDKIGHFMQGLVPALVAREILLRLGYLSSRRMVAFLCVCVALAVSAVYELIEWGAAVSMGQSAEAFLGTGGDPWDAQQDILFALIGGLVAVLLIARRHDRQIRRFTSAEVPDR